MGAGLAELLDLSLILTCMAIGIAMVNLSPATGGASRGLVEGIMPPIYIVFFILAGMQFEFGLLYLAGILAVIYIVCRVAGKVLGISLTAKFSGAPTTFRKYLGFGMISQAGVAIGLAALLTTELAGLPEGAILATLGITVILATTIVFEIIGPIGVRYAIFKAGEARRK
jgi:Kef-type K+ transport system membrane component KefB